MVATIDGIMHTVKTDLILAHPYWNSSLSNLHKTMRQKQYAWINAGKPQQSSSLSYKEYKNAKRKFRRLHRQQVNA